MICNFNIEDRLFIFVVNYRLYATQLTRFNTFPLMYMYLHYGPKIKKDV